MSDVSRVAFDLLVDHTRRTLADRAAADLPLFARATDPETSHAAAASMERAAGLQRAAILAALAGGDGLTNDELDQWHGWRTGTASRRTGELWRAGLVSRGPDTRLTEGGRAALVYRLASCATA